MTHDPKELITALLLFGVSIAGFAFFAWLLVAFARAIAGLFSSGSSSSDHSLVVRGLGAVARPASAAAMLPGKAEAAPASPAAPVPAFVVNELPSADGVYDARVYRITDAFADAMAECDRLGLTGEERIEALAGVLRGAQPYRSAKPAARQGSGGAGGGRRMRAGVRAVIEAKAGRAWLGRAG
jgi:hypothetical protein